MNSEREYHCHKCSKQTRKSRIPKGWKHCADRFWCASCWKAQFILRAITIPVVEPLNGTWEELRSELRLMWIQTTMAANWILTELYARDVRKTEEGKMPKMPWVYL